MAITTPNSVGGRAHRDLVGTVVGTVLGLSEWPEWSFPLSALIPDEAIPLIRDWA